MDVRQSIHSDHAKTLDNRPRIKKASSVTRLFVAYAPRLSSVLRSKSEASWRS